MFFVPKIWTVDRPVSLIVMYIHSQSFVMKMAMMRLSLLHLGIKVDVGPAWGPHLRGGVWNDDAAEDTRSKMGKATLLLLLPPATATHPTSYPLMARGLKISVKGEKRERHSG